MTSTVNPDVVVCAPPHVAARPRRDDLLDAVVVTTGHDAYRRTDGIAVVPAALLGP